MKKEEIIREIYWMFRNAIHNGHIQIKVEDGKMVSHSKIEDCDCYVCYILHNLENDIASIFKGEEYYTCKKVVDAKGGKD